MARQDSSFGIWNYTQVIKGTSATSLLSPVESGVNASFPSPLFPATTAVNPVGLFIGIPRDSGLGIDGHPFEVQLTANISGTLTTTVQINLFNATESSWIGGPYHPDYTLGTLGAGCTNVVSGSAASGIAASTNVNIWMKAQFLWSSATGILGCTYAQQFLNGNVVSINSLTNVSGIKMQDLNFIPQFTFASGGVNTLTISEFVINRL